MAYTTVRLAFGLFRRISLVGAGIDEKYWSTNVLFSLKVKLLDRFFLKMPLLILLNLFLTYWAIQLLVCAIHTSTFSKIVNLNFNKVKTQIFPYFLIFPKKFCQYLLWYAWWRTFQGDWRCTTRLMLTVVSFCSDFCIFINKLIKLWM